VQIPRRAAAKKKTAQRKGPPKKRTGAKARLTAVKRILRNVEKKMAGNNAKATLGDYIRLLQLQKEMGEEPLSEIEVTWIETPAAEK
jgi:hypothetical protein